MSNTIEFRGGVQRYASEGREWVPAEDYDRLRDVADRLVSAFKQARADLALSSGTWSNAASFGLQPEDIGLKRIDEDSPTPGECDDSDT